MPLPKCDSCAWAKRKRCCCRHGELFWVVWTSKEVVSCKALKDHPGQSGRRRCLDVLGADTSCTKSIGLKFQTLQSRQQSYVQLASWQARSCKGNKRMESEAKRQECRTSRSQCQTKSRATEEGSWAEATRGKKLKVWRIFWVTPFSVVYLQAEAKLRKEKEQKEKEETKYQISQISSLLLLLGP